MRGSRQLVALVLLGLVLTGCASSRPRNYTQRTFTRQVANRLAAADPSAAVQVAGQLNLRLRGRQQNVPLQDLWGQYQDGGKDPDLLIDGLVSYLTEKRPPLALTWAEAKGRVVPLLAGAQGPPAPPGGLVSVDWQAGLKVYLALDGSRGFIYLIPDDLAHWQVSRDEVYTAALDNLRLRTDDQSIRRARVSDIPGLYLYVYQAKDGLDASRLLLVNDWRRRLLPFIDWDMVVIIPDRDEIIAFDGRRKDWVKVLQDYSKSDYRAAANPVSDQLYAVHDGRLVIYKP